MKRKLAEHDNLKVIIEQTGDKFHIKESSTFRNKDIDFTLGVQFDYSLADGTEVSVSGPRSGSGIIKSMSRCCFRSPMQREMICFRKIWLVL